MVRRINRPGRLIPWVEQGGAGDVSALTDEDLVVSVRAGDVDSLGVLVGRWERPLFRFVSRLLDRPDDARDVCQETFLRILRKSDAFRDGARFSTWMYQIALNLCRDHARRRKRWGHLVVASTTRGDEDAVPRESAAPRTIESDPDAALEHQERRRAVQKALHGLSRDQREVLVLKEYEGLKFREIADVLGVPESTVKSRMYAALDTMRVSLSASGIR
jgi:RNA polymerase sigma-70 factor, ECF subfamily